MKRKSNFDDDVVSNVFLFIPAETLHKTMKLVCRQWKRIIENKYFIRQHVLNSDLILLKEINHDHAFSRCNVKVQNNSIHAIIETENHLQFPGRVSSSIDGLLMFGNRHNGILSVSNPVTKEVVELPSRPSILHTRQYVMIVPVTSGIEYKLVSLYVSSDSRAMYVYITSVGNGVWKRIDQNYRNDHGKIPEQFEDPAIPVEGFIFWAKHNCSYIISVDMKTEKFVEFAAPAVDVRENYVYYITMKNKLSCIHWKDQRNWQVFLLEVSRKTGVYEWSKIHEIEWDSGCFVPLAWAENNEVLIFTCKCKVTPGEPEILAFNVVSKSSTCFTYIGVKTPGFSWQLPHVDSLVSLASLN